VVKISKEQLNQLEVAEVLDNSLKLPTRNEFIVEKKVVKKPEDSFNIEQPHPKLIYQGAFSFV